MRIYLDVCCINRPFDDIGQDRIRIESEAVLTILTHSYNKEWVLLNSKIIDFEIAMIPDDDRRQKVRILSSMLHPYIFVDDDIERRAKEKQIFY